MNTTKRIVALMATTLCSSGFAQVGDERCVVKRPRAGNGETVAAKMLVINDGERCAMRVGFSGGPATSLIIHAPPGSGTLVGATSEVYYTPNPGFVGQDSFDVQWFGMGWGPYISNHNIRTTVRVTVRAKNPEPPPVQ